MAFQGKRGGGSVRLTGLFVAKSKKGLATGTAKGEELDGLIAKIKEAKASGNGLVFFLWKQEGNPPFSLSVDVSKPYDKSRQRSGKKIESSGFDDDEIPGSDDLFS